MAPFLTKILMETGQQVPDFLESFKPASGELNFEEEEDDDAVTAFTTGGAKEDNGTWGAGDATQAATNSPGDTWGAKGDATQAVISAPADVWGNGNGEGNQAKAQAW